MAMHFAYSIEYTYIMIIIADFVVCHDTDTFVWTRAIRLHQKQSALRQSWLEHELYFCSSAQNRTLHFTFPFPRAFIERMYTTKTQANA